jgi:nucleoside-diphosphate-sugar epimerase
MHCIGLLFDDASGLGNFNRFVSGSGSLPDADSTYDSITRLSAFNAIDAAVDYTKTNQIKDFPFVFISAAEAGWPDVPGGPQIEQFLAPEWLRRYLTAKRAVEARLLETQAKGQLRPVIPRPSLVYSLDRPSSYLSVGAFFVGNKAGLPFVDRPVTVQSLATAIVRSISQPSVSGVLRFQRIDELSQ